MEQFIVKNSQSPSNKFSVGSERNNFSKDATILMPSSIFYRHYQ